MTETQKEAPLTIMTGSFHDREAAERAYDDIVTRGYESGDIHVFMSDDTRKRLFVKEGDMDDMGHKSLQGAGVGGMVGGAVGATVVGLAAAAASLTIPVLGLVIAGPLAGALAGAAAGATAGGLLGVLVGAGIPETRAKVYETEMKSGSIVLGVTPRHAEDAKYFETRLQGPNVSA